MYELPLQRHKDGDLAHIAKHVAGKSAEEYVRLLRGYLTAWREAAVAEPLSHRRNNAGRAVANEWIRLEAERMDNDTKAAA